MGPKSPLSFRFTYAGDVLRHYLAAACDPLDAAGRVAKRGDELLRKRCAVDSPKPAVDLEDAALVRSRHVLQSRAE